MSGLGRAVNLADVREAARRRLPKPIFDVIEGGHGDDITVHRNRAALDRISLRPRALSGITQVDTEVTVLGRRSPLPILLAPCSFSRVCHPHAERAVAQAAGRAGIEYLVPGAASESLEAVAGVASAPLWYQLYVRWDSARNHDTVRRAAEAGYRVLCVTIDTPVKPYRETDLRNGVRVPVSITPALAAAGLTHPRWAKNFLIGNASAGYSLHAARAAYDGFTSTVGDLRAVSRDDIEWIRAEWDGPLVVKGVLRPDEVDELVDLGVNGIVVSNHGGRNLDGTPATIDVLPEIVEAVAGRLSVFMDSGIRRGTDIVKALALGADAVLLGRPYLFGLAAGGQAGIEQVIAMIRNELEFALLFLGVGRVEELDRSVIEWSGAGTSPGRATVPAERSRRRG